jgi:hypothetical protein
MNGPFWLVRAPGERLSVNPDGKRTLWYYFCAE